MAAPRPSPVPADALAEALAEPEVYNVRAFADLDEGEIVEVAADLIDYCRGDVEGADLQLSDSHDLPLAQAIAEEELAAESGFDEDGLPFDPSERRFLEIDRTAEGLDAEAARAAARAWLERHEFSGDAT